MRVLPAGLRHRILPPCTPWTLGLPPQRRPLLTSLTLAYRSPFSSSAAHRRQAMPSRPPPPPDDEIDEFFVKGTGPGGQKINKTNSAVQLRHRPTGIVVKSQATRSRSQNRTIARQLLAARLDELRNGDQSRTAVVGAVKQARKASAAKKSRRKYRQLEAAKKGAEGRAAGGDGAEEDTGDHDHDVEKAGVTARDTREGRGGRPSQEEEDPATLISTARRKE